MRQFAPFLIADAGVGIIGAFMNMALVALGTLLAVTQVCKGPTHGRAGSQPDMGIPTVRVDAAAAKKMHTSGGSMGRRLMGEIATYTCIAITSLKEVLAHGDFVGVMDIETIRSLVAGS